MEELKKFQSSTFDTLLREEDSSKINIRFWNLLVRYRNCKMKLIEWMIQESFKMLNQYAMDIPTLPVNLCLSHFIQFLVECKPFFWNAEPQRRAAKHLGHAWFFGKRFCRSSGVFCNTLCAGIESMEFRNIRTDSHSSTAEKNENQTPVQDQRCQSGPSAKNSVIPTEGDSSKNYGADQQRLQISDLHLDKFTTPSTFARWKIRFKTEVCTCSQFPTEAMHWIKEVEMVDSVDDFRSSLSVRGIWMPDFEVIDARIASALNRIIHNSHFERRVSLEEQEAQKEDRFLRGWQIAYPIYEYFRVTGANDSVENHADLFTIVFEMMIFRNSIQSGTEFCLWRKSDLMTSWKDCTN